MKEFRIMVLIIIFAFSSGCEPIVTYPNTPVIKFKNYSIYLTTDDLGNKIALVKLQVEFTDGDGDIGFHQPGSTEIPDSMKYNFFLTLYDFKKGKFEKVDNLEGNQNFRVPYIEREGQNKTLKGDIFIDLEYKSIIYDTIFYSFYLVDRKFHKSNVDSTDVIVLSGIQL